MIVLSLVTVEASAADTNFSAVGLVGSGRDTGDADNNPYRLQLGAAGELTINGFVLGVRGTRTFASHPDCTGACLRVMDLRTVGADFGFDWELGPFHLGPRFGVGHLKERHGDISAVYLDPGAVAEIEMGVGTFTLGVDVRYRVVMGEPDVNGWLGYLRAGLRF